MKNKSSSSEKNEGWSSLGGFFTFLNMDRLSYMKKICRNREPIPIEYRYHHSGNGFIDSKICNAYIPSNAEKVFFYNEKVMLF